MNYRHNNYPYYNTYIDSLPLRLEWINNTYDNGALFYVTLIRDSYSKLFKNAELTVKNIIGKIQEHNTHLSTLEAQIYAEKVKYASKDDCISLIEKRIVKTYTYIADLENDNGSQEVRIDENKILNQRTKI